MKIKDKKYLIILLVAFILLISIVIIYLLNNTKVMNKILGKEPRQAELEQKIEYKVYKYLDNEGKMLIKFQDSENGIERIEYPNNENTLTCNGKNVVIAEYPIAKDKNYEFKMYTTRGEEIKSNITINDEFIYANGINFEKKKTGTGYKIINLTYMQDMNDSFKYYYKIGENGEWEEYDGPVWLFDYDVVKENLINTEDNTVTLYARSVNDVNEEVIVSKKYDVDINATETSLTAESLLEAASKEEFTAGTYKVKINDETYSLHVYEFDESQIWSDNVTFGSKKDVATSTSDMAKNMVVVKINGDLTIDEGVTVTAYANENGYGGPKGILIYCTGTLTNNGTISMTARGAYAEGQNVYLYKNADNTYEYVPSAGGDGAPRVGRSSGYSPAPGATGKESIILRGTGGRTDQVVQLLVDGVLLGVILVLVLQEHHIQEELVVDGCEFGMWREAVATSGYDNGGKGGPGYEAGQGAGNPGGTNGTGGLLTIYANTIVNNNKIEANGSPGGGAWPGGGSSGGGSINIFYRNQIENGTITANGGYSAAVGGAGGKGSVTIGNISSGTFVKDE